MPKPPQGNAELILHYLEKLHGEKLSIQHRKEKCTYPRDGKWFVRRIRAMSSVCSALPGLLVLCVLCVCQLATFSCTPESDGDGAFYECRWGLTIEVIVSSPSEAALFRHPLLSEQGVKLRLKRRHLQPQTPPWHKHTWQTRKSPQALLEQRKTHARRYVDVPEIIRGWNHTGSSGQEDGDSAQHTLTLNHPLQEPEQAAHAKLRECFDLFSNHSY